MHGREHRAASTASPERSGVRLERLGARSEGSRDARERARAARERSRARAGGPPERSEPPTTDAGVPGETRPRPPPGAEGHGGFAPGEVAPVAGGSELPCGFQHSCPWVEAKTRMAGAALPCGFWHRSPSKMCVSFRFWPGAGFVRRKQYTTRGVPPPPRAPRTGPPRSPEGKVEESGGG